jgi:5-formyltetrahydrofolate cyclo-ligase
VTIDRKLLREEIKNRLQLLASKGFLFSSQKIATKIIHSQLFTESENIACYIPMKGEVDVWPIIKNIWAWGKNCYIPTFSSHKINYLCFVKFESGDDLINVKHKILAPKIIQEKIMAPQDLDLVIIPLIGFNKDRFRLGRGGGDYDRTFAFKKNLLSFRPYLLGVGYECQRVEFEPAVWDIQLDEIIVG